MVGSSRRVYGVPVQLRQIPFFQQPVQTGQGKGVRIKLLFPVITVTVEFNSASGALGCTDQMKTVVPGRIPFHLFFIIVRRRKIGTP